MELTAQWLDIGNDTPSFQPYVFRIGGTRIAELRVPRAVEISASIRVLIYACGFALLVQ